MKLYTHLNVDVIPRYSSMRLYTDNDVFVTEGAPSVPAPQPPTTGSITVYAEGADLEVREIPTEAPLPLFEPRPVPEVVSIGYCLCFVLWSIAGRYVRLQRFAVLGTFPKLDFQIVNFAAGGVPVLLRAGEAYKLYVGEPGSEQLLHTMTLTSDTYVGRFLPDLSGLPAGDHRFVVAAEPGNGFGTPNWMHTGGADHASTYIVQPGSYDLTHGQPYQWTRMPAVWNPPARPLVPRECVPFSAPLRRANYHRTNLVPVRGRNIFRPSVTPEGVWTSANPQAYAYENLLTAWPTYPEIDGERGIGAMSSPTHIMIDRHGGAYCTTARSVRRVSPTGKITTRAGLRVKPGSAPGYYELPADLIKRYKDAISWKQWETAFDLLMEMCDRKNVELVGDFSGVDRRYRVPHEIWGAAWWPRSVETDPNAPPIGGEPPHHKDFPPTLLFTATQSNATYKLTFHHDDHAPPVASLFRCEQAAPWAVAIQGDVAYITEQFNSRVQMYDVRTGADLGTFYRALHPNDCFIFDDELWVASWGLRQWHRVKLATGEGRVHCAIRTDGNSKFCKGCMSDGTFMSRGTLAYTTWSNRTNGPDIVLPDGKGIDPSYWLADAVGPSCGKGGAYEVVGYLAAPAIGMGRMIYGSSQEGLYLLSKALVSDPTIDLARYERGQGSYVTKGYPLIYGDHGFPYHSNLRPPEYTNDERYYLDVEHAAEVA